MQQNERWSPGRYAWGEKNRGDRERKEGKASWERKDEIITQFCVKIGRQNFSPFTQSFACLKEEITARLFNVDIRQ